MNCEFLPSGKSFPTESARLFGWFLRRLLMALLNLLPRVVSSTGFLYGGFGLDLGLFELVLAHQML